MSNAHAPLHVVAFAGSLRRNSYNRWLLDTAAYCAPPGIIMTMFDTMADIPLFDEDLEAETAGGPEGVKRLRHAVAAADALLIATPEYNQSLPGVLKNTLDWLSRDDVEHGEVVSCMPTAIIGATAGRWGTRLAQAQLRHALAAMGALTMPAPQVYVADAARCCDRATGRFDVATQEKLHAFLLGFQAWIQLLQGERDRR